MNITATVADLVEQLGGIPLERIRLKPHPGTATVQDVVDILERENRLFELVDGVLVEKAVGFYEGRLAALIVYFIEDFLEDHDLGIAVGADGTVEIAFALVRIPDVSFVSWTRLPGRRLPADPIPHLVPNLAVEVISKSNTPKEMRRKLEEYFSAGVQLVWFVYPQTRTAEVYTAVEQVAHVPATGSLVGGDVLPGFNLALKKLFSRAGRLASRGRPARSPKNGAGRKPNRKGKGPG
jgi:Uma2 family endonuclease